ncbi:folate-binding protein [Pelagibacterales bacterium SAG-MED47]|nr:folate-binding protein [Pelagibacterales bacterium SAG-MED47]
MNNSVFILKDRSIIYISGIDSKNFLQNLISNDINKVTDNSSCFASLLTPQGKFLYEFLIIKHKSGFFIDCEKTQSDEIFRQLNLYKMRSRVEILNLSNEFVVASFDYKKYLSIKGSKDILGFTFKYREDPVFLDPRNKELGARLIINLEKLYLSLKKLNLKDDKIESYYIKSHKLGIVPKDLNKLQNKLFGIECNYEELNGIDFKKGCYVGQENTARIKLKNKLSKRLFPIKIIDGKILDNEKIYFNGIEIGKVLINGKYPFALIKYLNDNFNIEQTFKSENGTLKVLIPPWLKI